MTAPTAMTHLIDSVRSLYADELPPEQLWAEVVPALAAALTDDVLRDRAREWPLSHDRENNRYTNLLFHEDPDYGFVVNGLVKDSTGRTPVHDHGHAWVAYGLLEGRETILRYGEVGDAPPVGLSDLSLDEEIPLNAGEVDLVPPWTFHAEQADTDRTVAVMVRSAKVGVFAHRRFDPGSGEIYDHPGPTQIPYDLG